MESATLFPPFALSKAAVAVETTEEKAQRLFRRLNQLFEGFREVLHEAGNTNPDEDRYGSRHLSLAFTHLEDAVLRASSHITTELVQEIVA